MGIWNGGHYQNTCIMLYAIHRKKLLKFYHCKNWVYITFYYSKAIYNLLHITMIVNYDVVKCDVKLILH